MRIVVIGAGLLGITSAWFLQRAGHHVVVVERCGGPGLETSFANGGMLTPSQAAPWNTPGIGLKLLKWVGREESPILFSPGKLASLTGWGLSFLRHSSPRAFAENRRSNAALAQYSLGILGQLRRDLDLPYDGSSKGTLKLYRDAREYDHARRLLEDPGAGQASFEVVDREAILGLEPSLAGYSGKMAGGLYFPGDEAGDAYKFCHEMARHAAVAGVEFRYGVSVDRLNTGPAGIESLQTPGGPVRADVYLLAAGSYSPVLARTAGLSLPVKPVKGYSITLGVRRGAPALPVIDESRHIAVTPLGDRIRVAGIAELAGYDSTVDRRRVGMMYRFFRELYPDLGFGPELEDGAATWAGLRPYCSDGVPLIGPSPLQNLYLNTGHGHLGWTMAAGSARLAADLIGGAGTGLDPRPYRLDRFSGTGVIRHGP